MSASINIGEGGDSRFMLNSQSPTRVLAIPEQEHNWEARSLIRISMAEPIHKMIMFDLRKHSMIKARFSCGTLIHCSISYQLFSRRCTEKSRIWIEIDRRPYWKCVMRQEICRVLYEASLTTQPIIKPSKHFKKHNHPWPFASFCFHELNWILLGQTEQRISRAHLRYWRVHFI